MSNLFKYSLLRYVHSDLLGESLNIGILFIFNDGNIVFKYPGNYGRIRGAYGESFSDSTVNGVLKGILRRVADINFLGSSTLNIFDENADNKSITDRILIKDATVLRFDAIKTAVQYSDQHLVVSDFYDLYFSHFSESTGVIKKHDEEYISKSLKALLQKGNSEYHKYISKDVEIQVPILPEGKFSFDFSWQNQVQHYVKPIGFDFQDSKSINQKAATYFGYLTAISDSIGDDSVDIVTAAPQNKLLYSAYDKAIKMLDTVKIKKNIIQQSEYRVYAEEILENIESHN